MPHRSAQCSFIHKVLLGSNCASTPSLHHMHALFFSLTLPGGSVDLNHKGPPNSQSYLVSCGTCINSCSPLNAPLEFSHVYKANDGRKLLFQVRWSLLPLLEEEGKYELWKARVEYCICRVRVTAALVVVRSSMLARHVLSVDVVWEAFVLGRIRACNGSFLRWRKIGRSV